MQNVTSNEDIRHRWNGHHRNRKMVKIFKREAGCCGRMKYLLCGDIEYYHGRSRLDQYSEYVETHKKIARLHEQKNQEADNEQQGLLIESQIYSLKKTQQRLEEKLRNIEILEEDYGIKIPDNDLNHFNFDEELVKQYFQEKTRKHNKKM